jgi:hypothetical protein
MDCSIVIGGTVRNCGKHLLNTFRNIETICDHFNVVKVVYFYDSSSDNTLEVLREIQSRSDIVEVIVNSKMLTPHRTVNISNGRNALLDYINALPDKPDYFIMMDMDDVCADPINIGALQDAFRKRSEWDIVSFMNENYYDFWALSFGDYVYSCLHNNNHRIVIDNMRSDLYRMIKDKPYMMCHSAFNGFAIYNLRKVDKIRYGSIVPSSFYTQRYGERMKAVEKKTGTKYILKGEQLVDCEHRIYQIMCHLIHGARVMILNQNLFPRRV